MMGMHTLPTAIFILMYRNVQINYELSGKNPDDLLVGVRDTVEEDKSKRNPADFGLWFTSSKFNNQIMKWDSPWELAIRDGISNVLVFLLNI